MGQVELYAEVRAAENPFREPMNCTNANTNCEGRPLYSAGVPAGRPSGDYTARIVPAHPGVNVPLENGMVLWEQ